MAPPAQVVPRGPEAPSDQPARGGDDEWNLALANQGEAPVAEPDETEAPNATPGAKLRRKSLEGAAREDLAEGQRLLRAQKYDEAKLAFEKASRSRGMRGRALLGMGQVAFQQQNYAEAARRAQQGAGAGAGVPAHVLLGDAYFKLNNFASAKKAYSDALKLDPNNKAAQSNLESAQRRLQ